MVSHRGTENTDYFTGQKQAFVLDYVGEKQCRKGLGQRFLELAELRSVRYICLEDVAMKFLQMWLLGLVNPSRMFEELKRKPAPLWGFWALLIRFVVTSLTTILALAINCVYILLGATFSR